MLFERLNTQTEHGETKTADQTSRRLSKNGEKATQRAEKPIAFVILDWIKRQCTNGGAWAKPSKAFPLNYPRALTLPTAKAGGVSISILRGLSPRSPDLTGTDKDFCPNKIKLILDGKLGL